MSLHHFLITLSGSVQTDSVVFAALPATPLTPIQGMLVALGQCTILTLNHIGQRQRQTIQHYHCTITAQQRNQHPRMFAAIDMHITVIGDTLDPKRIAQAWQLVPNYCPVHATIAMSCPITHQITIAEVL